MRRGALLPPLALVVALAAGCGGGGKPAAESARPCLAKLGLQYVHHRPEQGLPSDPTPRLPLLDPDNPPSVGQTPTRLAWPKDFREYGEVLYSPDQPGANAVQIFIFGDEELPKRVLDTFTKFSRSQPGVARGSPFGFGAGAKLVRLGQSLVVWSSAPTRKQRAGVRQCLAPA